jgi:hypothetical protein
VLNLSTPASTLSIVTGSAAAVDAHSSYLDLVGVSITPGQADAHIAAATSTVLVTPPPVGARNVKFVSLRNKDALLSCQVAIVHFDGIATATLFDVTLRAGWAVQYNTDGSGFVVYDANGCILGG